MSDIGRNISVSDWNRIASNAAGSYSTQPDEKLQKTENKLNSRNVTNGNPAVENKSQSHIVTASEFTKNSMRQNTGSKQNDAAVGEGKSESFLSKVGSAVADGFRYLKEGILYNYFITGGQSNVTGTSPQVDALAVSKQKNAEKRLNDIMNESFEKQKRILEHRRNMLDPAKKEEFLRRQKNFTNNQRTTEGDFINGFPISMLPKQLAYQQLNEQYKGRSISESQLDKLADKKVKDDIAAIENDIKNGTISRNVSTNVIDRVSKQLEYDRMTNSDYVRTMMKRTEDADNYNKKLLLERASDKNVKDGYFERNFKMPFVHEDVLDLQNFVDDKRRKDSGKPVTPTYYEDVVHSFMQGQALTRIADIGGDLSQIGEFKKLSTDVGRLMDLYSAYDNLSAQLQKYISRGNNLTTAELKAESELLDARKDIVNEIRQLRSSNAAAMLSSWESAEYKARVGAGSGVSLPFRPRNIIEKLNPYLHKLNMDFGIGVSQHLDGIGNLIDSLEKIRSSKDFERSAALQQKASDIQKQIKSILGKFDGALDERNKERLEEFKDESASYEKLKKDYKISDVYQARQQLAQDMKLGSKYTYDYALPQQLGTSNPYPFKMVATMGLAALNGVAGAARKYIPQMITGLAFGVSSATQGADEANAEVYDSTKNMFYHALAENDRYADFIRIGKQVLKDPNASQDDIFVAYMSGKLDNKLGSIEPAVAKDLASSFIGSSRQFDLNIAAVSTDAVMDAILMTTRLGWFEDAYNSAKNTLGKAAFLVSPREYAKALTPNSWHAVYNNLKAGASAFGAKLPYFGARHALTKDIKALVGRNMVQNIFEAAQEGVQRDLAVERENGEYTSYQGGSLIENAIRDMATGIPLTLEWITGGALNFGAIKDESYIANMNGGFLGSIFQGGGTQVLTQGRSMINNAREAEAVISKISGEKAKHRDNIERTAAYLNNLNYDKRNRINNLLDAYKTATENRIKSDPNANVIPVEAIEDTRKMYQEVYNLATNNTKALASAASIAKPGSKRWRYAMGIIQDAIMTQKESEDREKSEQAVIDEAINKAKLELADKETDEKGVINNVGNVINAVDKIAEVAKLAAAIKIRDDYKDLSNLSKTKTRLVRLAQNIIDDINKGRESKINTIDEVNKEISDIDLHKTLENSYRDLLIAQMYNNANKYHLKQSLNFVGPMNAYLSRLVDAYQKSKKSDESFYQKIQNAYNKRVDHIQEVEDFEINDWNRIYKIGKSTYIAEEITRDDGSKGYVKRLYDEEKEAAVGPAKPFDKEEFVWAKKLEHYNEEEAKKEWEDKQNKKVIDKVSQAFKNKLDDINKAFNKLKNLKESKSKKQKRSLENQLKNKERRFKNELPEGFVLAKDDAGYHIEIAPVSADEEVVDVVSTKEPIIEEIQQEPTEQQSSTLDKLREYAEKAKSMLLPNLTTSEDYFFKDEKTGKVIRRSRVHSAFEQQKPMSTEAKIKEKQLREIKTRSVEEYKEFVINAQKEYNEKLYEFYKDDREEADARTIDLSVYLSDDVMADEGSVRSVAKILTSGHGNNALHAGSILDDVLRRLFNGEDLSIDSEIKLGKRPVHKLGDYMTGDMIVNLTERVREFKKSHPTYTFYSDPITWQGELSNGVKVAGETDLIAIDENGDIYIIDFKTSKNEFTEENINNIFPGDNWSTKEQYSRQQTAYMNMISQSVDNAIVKGIYIYPFVVSRVSGNDVSIFSHFESIEERDLIPLEINKDINQEFGSSVEERRKGYKLRIDDISSKIKDLESQIDAAGEAVNKRSKDLYNSIVKRFDEITTIVLNGDELALNSVNKELIEISKDIQTLIDYIKVDVESYSRPPEAGNKKEGAPKSAVLGFTFVEEGNPDNRINPDVEKSYPVTEGRPEVQQARPEDNRPGYNTNEPGPYSNEPGPYQDEPGPDEIPGYDIPLPPPDPYSRSSRKEARRKNSRPLPPPDEGARMSRKEWLLENVENPEQLVGINEPDRELPEPPSQQYPNKKTPEAPTTKAIDEQNDRLFSFSAIAKRMWTGGILRYNFIQYLFKTSARAKLKVDIERLEKWSTQPDFLTDAIITINIASFKKKSKTFAWDNAIPKKRNASGIPQDYEITLDITYNGQHITGIPVLYATEQNEGVFKGLELHNKIQQCLDVIERHPELHGKASVRVTKASRTNGILEFDEDGKTSTLLDAGLMHDEEELLTLLDDNKIGLSATNEVASVRGQRGNILGSVLRAFERGREVKGGFVIYMWNLLYNEDENGVNVIPIFLTPKKLTTPEESDNSDVATIVKILKAVAENHHNLDKKFTIQVNGKEVETPVTYGKVLNTLIRFSKLSRDQKNSNFIFDWQRSENGRVENYAIIEITDNDGNLVHVDLNNPDHVERLTKTLSSSRFLYVNNKNTLTYDLGESDGKGSSKANPFKGLKQFFIDNPDVQQVKICDSFVVDRKDLDFHEDGTWKSLSGAAWQIRHGNLGTTITGIHSALISIDDVGVYVGSEKYSENAQEEVKEPTAESDTKDIQTIEGENGETLEIIIEDEENNDEIISAPSSVEASVLNAQKLNDISLSEEDEDEYEDLSYSEEDDFEDEMYQTQKELSKTKINEKLAKKRIRRLLGKHFPVEIIDGVYAIFKDGYAVGVCRESMIGLSRYAEQGTEWHEAFHKIFEFLVSPLKRDRIYERYEKALGTDDKRIIAEAIADDFKTFMMNLPEVKLHVNIFKTLREIGMWMNSFRNISDKELARIYLNANLGVYRFINAKSGVLERFNSLFGGNLYSFVKDANGKNIKLKYFVNDKQLRDALKLLSVQIISGSKVDELGYNAKEIPLELNDIRKLRKVKAKETDENADSNWFTLLTGWDKNEADRTLSQNMFHEIFDNWDNVMKGRMINVLSQYGLIYSKNKTAEEQKNNKEDTPDQIAQMLTGHMDEYYLHDRRNDIDSAIVFFLSTIPNRRFATRDDLIYETDDLGNIKYGEDGKAILRYTTDAEGNKIIAGSVKALEVKRGNSMRRTTVNVSTNSFGMAEFIPFDKVYADIFREIHDAKSFSEMMSRIKNKAKTDAMFYYLEQHLTRWEMQSLVRHVNTNKPVVLIQKDGKTKELNENSYMIAKDLDGRTHVIDKNKRIIKDAYILTNPDRQSLVTRFYMAFKAQRLEFNFMYANERKQDSNGEVLPTGKYDYYSRKSGTHASTAIYPPMWFENLRLGITDVFEVGEGSKIRKKNGGKSLSDEADFFVNIKSAIVNAINTKKHVINLEGRNWNLYSDADIDSICSIFVSHLNTLGIDIDASVFNYFLEHKFGSDECNTRLLQLYAMFVTEPTAANGKFSYKRFCDVISAMANSAEGSDLSLIEIDHELVNVEKRKGKYVNVRDKKPNSGLYLYANNSFVKELAIYYGEYRLDTDEFMQVGPENSQMFTEADDHTASFITTNINNGRINEHGAVVGSSVLKDMKDYVYNFFEGKGSRIIKYLLNPNRSNLKLGTFIGINNLNRHDGGTKYSKISTREDLLSKLTLLSEGYILFPTLSDKSTWFFLHTDSPGEQLLPGFDYLREGGISEQSLPIFEGKTIVSYNNEVLDQLIEYALCEDAAIQVELEKKGKKSRFVKHFDSDEQGQRYQFMLGIYEDNGKGETVFVPFNRKKNADGSKMTPEDCFKLAHEKFFDKDDDTRRKIVAEILRRRTQELVDFAIKNDVIKRGKDGFLYNNYLDYGKIEALKEAYKNIDRYKNYKPYQLESMAIAAYLLDANARSIMSIEETERMYTGHPGFFKHIYDENGILIDRHGDEVKRFGGLGSTGPNNREDLPNISSDYTCAEIKDWEVGSALSETLSEAFKDNEYREAAVRIVTEKYGRSAIHTLQRRKATKEIYDMKLEDVEKILVEHGVKELIDDKIQAEAGAFKSEINVADGTAYITDKMAENLLIQRGAYTKRVRAAFQYLRGRKDKEGKDVLNSAKAYRIVVNALISTEKYSAFGYRMEEGVPVHFYNKYALFPLFDTIAYGFTADLYDKMKKDNVDMVMFSSAVKSGSEHAQKFNPEMSKKEVEDFSFKGKTYKQKYAFVRRQLNTEPHEDETMSMGTQALKVALSNIIMDGSYETDYGTLYGEEIRDSIMECINKLADIGRDELMEEISVDGVNVDIEKFGEFIKKELARRNADANTLSAFDIEETVVNGIKTKKFKVPMAAMSSTAWVESIISSIINRKVINVNLPGNAYYQRSVFGIDDEARTVVGKDIYNGNKLQMINKEGSMDAVISIDYFYHIIPKDIRYNFEEARKWLIDNKIIGENATANTMAYRIPTQAQSSIHALRFVDVVSTVRDTIILPTEFTKITGSDFDIDKLFLSSLNYKVLEDGKATAAFDPESEVSKYTQNKLLNLFLTLLKDGGKLDPETGKVIPGRTIQYLHRSIDDDTKLVKNIHKKLVKRSSSPEEAFGFGSLSTQVGIKKSFINGKFGIGPYALNNNAQILTTLYGVEFADNAVLSPLGITSLCKHQDKDGNSIMSWLSGMINAHVDVAKDPYISDMNINKYTYNLSNLLLRTGMGDQTFAFLMQDVLMESSNTYDNAGDSLIDDPGLSAYDIQNNAVHEMLRKKFLDNGMERYKEEMDLIFGDVFMSKENRDKLGLLRDKIINIGKQMFTLSEDGSKITRKFYVQNLVNGKSEQKLVDEGNSIFEDMIINPNRKEKYAIKVGDHYIYYSRQELQFYTALLKELLDPYARKMSDVVNNTKIDTKKQGSSFFEQEKYLEKFEDMFEHYELDEDENKSSHVFNENFDDMLTKSFLAHKTEMTIDLFSNILRSGVINSVVYQRGFGMLLDDTMNKLGLFTDAHRKTMSNMLLGAIKGRFFDNYATENGIDIKGLFYGRDSIANRLQMLKGKLRKDTTGKYSKLATNGVITNTLLDSLSSVPYERKEGDPMFVTIPNNALKEKDTLDDISDSWNELLLDDSEEYKEFKKFAEDLILYAFYTSADTPGFTKIFKYVPNSWRVSSGYAAYMDSVATAFKNSMPSDESQLFFDAAMNCWQNPQILKLTRAVDKIGVRYKSVTHASNQDGERKLHARIIAPIRGAFRMISRNRSGEFPTFYKIRNPHDSSSPLIYIKIAESYDGGIKAEDKTYPVYHLVRPKGRRFKAMGQSFQIYEYSKDTGVCQALDGLKINGNDIDLYLNESKMNTIRESVAKLVDIISKGTFDTTKTEDRNKIETAAWGENGLAGSVWSSIMMGIAESSSDISESQDVGLGNYDMWDAMIEQVKKQCN